MPDRVDYYFDELRLHVGIKRDEAVREIRSALWFKAFGLGGMVVWPAEKRIASEAALKDIKERAERLADEFMAYQNRGESERKRRRIAELSDAAKAYGRDLLPGPRSTHVRSFTGHDGPARQDGSVGNLA